MIRILLYPFSLLYGIVISFRNFFYNSHIFSSVEFETPVISIGNITVGGTGKTPHTEYLITILRKEFRVATLSRGYKRQTSGFIIADNNSDYQQIGDEPAQMKRKFPEITVSVDKNRVSGIKKLLKAETVPAPDVILLDDAYQHRHVTPGINILLIDYNNPVWEDHLLPYGRLRESATEIRRAGIIIITKCSSEISPITRRIIAKNLRIKPYQDLFFTTIKYDTIQPAFKEQAIPLKEDELQSYSVLLVTGIANPQPLVSYLSQKVNALINFQFSDHHNFSPSDISSIESKFNAIENSRKIIVTTEKDWMRLAQGENISSSIQQHLFYVPVKISFLGQEGRTFDEKILNYVKENISNNDLHRKKETRRTEDRASNQ